PEAKPVSADDTALSGGKVGHRRTQFSETPPDYVGGRFHFVGYLGFAELAGERDRVFAVAGYEAEL
ncbi:hypothetical protein, partial [Mycolicibacter minnesotensis]|uniref:hypothetical protein n=1 Tax=Mycolicibacter minnesotensis TaxID=1118379 RepID=UPI001A988172